MSISLAPVMRIVSTTLLLGIVCAMAHAEENDAPPIVSVAVKTLDRSTPTMQPADGMPMMMAPEPPPPTLPAERFPQYRIGYQHADALLQSQVNAGAVRFLLTDPTILDSVGRPLLLEATILIDGEPFSSVRDVLSATKLAASTKPPVSGSVEQASDDSTDDESVEAEVDAPEEFDAEKTTRAMRRGLPDWRQYQ